jgi:hypothetical protein
MLKVYAAAVSTNFVSPVNTTQFGSLAQIFGWALNVIMGVGLSLVVVMLALGFVQYVISQGEKAGVDKAKNWITYAVIGGVGLLFVAVIRQLITSLTGANTQVWTDANLLI